MRGWKAADLSSGTVRGDTAGPRAASSCSGGWFFCFFAGRGWSYGTEPGPPGARRRVSPPPTKPSKSADSTPHEGTCRRATSQTLMSSPGRGVARRAASNRSFAGCRASGPWFAIRPEGKGQPRAVGERAGRGSDPRPPRREVIVVGIRVVEGVLCIPRCPSVQ